MPHLRIFVSFEFDRDNDLRGNFYSQTEKHSAHRIQDCSLRQDYPSEQWRGKAREAIGECDVVVVLVGADTHNAPGVRTEVEIARHLRKPVFQIIPQGRPYQGLPYINDRIKWRWPIINQHLATILISM